MPGPGMPPLTLVRRDVGARPSGMPLSEAHAICQQAVATGIKIPEWCCELGYCKPPPKPTDEPWYKDEPPTDEEWEDLWRDIYVDDENGGGGGSGGGGGGGSCEQVPSDWDSREDWEQQAWCEAMYLHEGCGPVACGPICDMAMIAVLNAEDRGDTAYADLWRSIEEKEGCYDTTEPKPKPKPKPKPEPKPPIDVIHPGWYVGGGLLALAAVGGVVWLAASGGRRRRRRR